MKTILTLVDYYLPGYKAGGPLRSISNLVSHLGEDWNFKIVTRDRDKHDPDPYPGVKPGCWHRTEHGEVLYLSPEELSRGFLRRVLRDAAYDALYLNSLFSPTFTLPALWLRRMGRFPIVPLILAPRGELSVGALAIKAMKKKSYITSSRLAGLYRDVWWHASSAYEAEDIRRVFQVPGRDGRGISVASDLPSRGVSACASPARPRKEKGRLRVIFISRISPKKNLDFALRILGGVKGEVEFSIYGPVDDDAYWSECEAIASALPENVHVVRYGPIEHDRVAGVFAEHDLFFFPTRGENYGHVIHEALMAGCPVLTSDQTPWRDLQARNAGWDLPLGSDEPYRAVLEKCLWMGPEEHAVWSAGARALGGQVSEAADVVEQNRALFSVVLSAAECPSRRAGSRR